MRTILTDPDYIIRWHRRSYASNRRRHAELTGSPPDRLTIVELRRPADVGRWARGPLADAAHVG